MIPRFWRPGRRHALARLALLPAAAVFRVTAHARTAWHASRNHQRLGCPALIVGNLSVGGTGKTPLVDWCARRLGAAGARVAIVVHPAALDEARLHAAARPAAGVHAARTRRAAVRRAAAAGATVVLLDDGLQHPGLEGAVRVCVMAVEQETWSPWTLPAGPWREPRAALGRADLVVVTRKTAGPAAAAALAARLGRATGRPVAVAALSLGTLRPLRGGAALPATALAGRRVLAVAGVADPEPVRAHLAATGAAVTLRAFPDHHRYRGADVRTLLEDSGRFDYVVVTSKDAVKLQTLWPARPEPLVAELAVHWEAGHDAVSAVLSRVLPERHVLTRKQRQAAAGTP